LQIIYLHHLIRQGSGTVMRKTTSIYSQPSPPWDCDVEVKVGTKKVAIFHQYMALLHKRYEDMAQTGTCTWSVEWFRLKMTLEALELCCRF